MEAWDTNKNLFEDYLKLFKRLNIGELTVDELNRFDQIHAGGIGITKKIASLSDIRKGSNILELGGGIGGVARFLAKNFDVLAYNLDLSLSYSITGLKLTSLINERLGVYFINGDATEIPFINRAFDIIWMQHINMNIYDKEKLFREMVRVLKRGGSIIFHEWFLKKEGYEDIDFPLPWTDTKQYNFLITVEEFIGLSEKFGLKQGFLVDDTDNALSFYKKLYENKAFLNPIFKERDGEAIFKNMISLIQNGKISVFYGKLIF